MNDPLLRRLGRLSQAEPDATRAARVLVRCHGALAGRQAARQPKSRRVTGMAWEPALVGGLCLVYLSEVVHQALLLYGML